MSTKITLVDDDRNITTSLEMALASEGFEVSVFHDGVAGFEGIASKQPDIAILDIKMPKMDGIELLQKLRNSDYTLPIIMLTSKDDEVDQIVGLRMGADDYITKPFSQRLLIERIKSLLRRQDVFLKDASGADSDADNANILLRGQLRLDSARHSCTLKGNPIYLTVTEFLLLKSLVIKPGHVKSRDQLIDDAYGEDNYVDDRIIDSHIKRIRKKFRDIDPHFNPIETIYGVGYKYEDSH